MHRFSNSGANLAVMLSPYGLLGYISIRDRNFVDIATREVGVSDRPASAKCAGPISPVLDPGIHTVQLHGTGAWYNKCNNGLYPLDKSRHPNPTRSNYNRKHGQSLCCTNSAREPGNDDIHPKEKTAMGVSTTEGPKRARVCSSNEELQGGQR